jgi:alpha-L-rhamnosidase
MNTKSIATGSKLRGILLPVFLLCMGPSGWLPAAETVQPVRVTYYISDPQQRQPLVLREYFEEHPGFALQTWSGIQIQAAGADASLAMGMAANDGPDLFNGEVRHAVSQGLVYSLAEWIGRDGVLADGTPKLRDGQLADGAVQAFAPNPAVLEPRDGGPAWADAMVICPWTIYLCYGDLEILRDNYEAMTRFMEHMDKHASLDGIRAHPGLKRWQGFGDWLALDNGDSWIGKTPIDLIGTAFHFYCAGLMARIADVLGHVQDAARFTQRREQVRAAFVRRFLGPEGLMEPVTQTALVLVLHFGLVHGPRREACARELVRMIGENDGHLQTGFVGTPYLLHALEATGHLDTAYRLLEKESYPSWLFPVNNGATTIWERWDGWTPEKGFQTTAMNSFNHYAYGAVGDWMVRSVAGLEIDETIPGYRSVIFRPRPGGSLMHARASLQTARGVVAIDWTLEGDALIVNTTLPNGCDARFDPPEEFRFKDLHVQSGTCRMEGHK